MKVFLRRQLWPDDPEFRIGHADRDAFVVLLTSTLLLLVFFYFGRPNFYVNSLFPGAIVPEGTAIQDVGPYLWWGATSLLLRVGAPLLIIVAVLRRSPGDYGFRLKGIGRHLPIYGLMYLVMLPILVWVSGFDSFLDYYPIYARATEGGAQFWLYQLGYGLQFVGVEAFFRGFMTFGLLPRFGALSVVIMTVPYTMIHFSKPIPEALAAIVAGLILGTLAVKSKSFVPGILLHVAVALTMDLLVLARLDAIGALF